MIREYFKHQGFFWTALSHIFSILKWSRTSFSCYGSFSTAVSHASWALGWPGVINLRGCIALILILRFLKRSGTSNSSHGAFSIASLHISWVLRLSGTSYSSHGWMRTAISWVFKSSGTSVKKLGLMCTNQFHGTCFETSHSFYSHPKVQARVRFYGLPKGILFMLHFHNPHPQVQRQNLRCWLYAKQLKQAQDNHQTYTQKDKLS